MRLTAVLPGDMTEEQRRVAEESASGKRGHVPTPLRAWLHSPEMGARAQRFGEFVRYDTSLGPVLSELAILVTARHWDSRYEWYAHKKEALKAGLDPAIIASIAAREAPVIADPRLRAGCDYVTALHETHAVPDAVHACALAALGERGLVELIGVIGYYTMVAMTLNAFSFPLPEGVAADF